MKLQTSSKFNTFNSAVPVQIDNFTPNSGKMPNQNSAIGRLNYRVQQDLSAIESGSREGGRPTYGMSGTGVIGEKMKKSRMSLGANHLLSQDAINAKLENQSFVGDTREPLIALYKRQPRSSSRGIQQAGKEFLTNRQWKDGLLPTLGLNRYRNEDLKLNTNNPFSVQRETERLLVARERERGVKETNKHESETLRVFQKSIATRQNRSGIIREINGIRPAANNRGTLDQLALLNNSSAEDYNTSKQQKLNIFDEADKGKLKKETLAKFLTNDQHARDYSAELKSIRSSHSSSQGPNGSFLHQDSRIAPRAVEYLSKGREQKETVRDFVF